MTTEYHKTYRQRTRYRGAKGQREAAAVQRVQEAEGGCASRGADPGGLGVTGQDLSGARPPWSLYKEVTAS